MLKSVLEVFEKLLDGKIHKYIKNHSMNDVNFNKVNDKYSIQYQRSNNNI